MLMLITGIDSPALLFEESFGRPPFLVVLLNLLVRWILALYQRVSKHKITLTSTFSFLTNQNKSQGCVCTRVVSPEN